MLDHLIDGCRPLRSLPGDLLKMTMLSGVEIEAAMEMQKRDPKERGAQQLLAREVTTLVHGEEVATVAEKVSGVLFGDMGLTQLEESELSILRSTAPSHEVQVDSAVVDVLVSTKLASSKREARQFLKDKAVILNNEVIKDEKRKLEASDFHNGIALLKRGRRNVCVLTLST